MQSTARLNTSYLTYGCPCAIHIYILHIHTILINKDGFYNKLSIYLYIIYISISI